MSNLSRRDVLAKTVAALAATAFGPRLIVTAEAHGIPQTHMIEIQSFKFAPDTLTVHVGDTITWTNRDVAPHTATAKDKSWDTGPIKKDESKSLEVTDNTVADFICRFHPMMKGKLTVESCMT
jgi:plastocyanin